MSISPANFQGLGSNRDDDICWTVINYYRPKIGVFRTEDELTGEIRQKGLYSMCQANKAEAIHPNGAAMTEKRIGLLGGTFDPIHMGHLLLAVHSYEELDLDRVIFIPARMPPHKGQPTVNAEQRLEMVRLAVGNDERFLVCACELSRTSTSYTIDTVRELQKSLGSDTKLFWLIGSDMLEDLPSWREVNELVDMVDVVVVQRAGQAVADFSVLRPSLTVEQISRIRAHAFNVSLIDISSTMVRERIAQGLSLRYFLPESVEKYISENKLYRQDQ